MRRRGLFMLIILFLFSNFCFSKSICEDRNFETIWKSEGPIEIVSEYGKPTTFSIEVPLIKEERGKVVVMKFKARLHMETSSGWNDYLGVEINGKVLSKYTNKGYSRLINRKEIFKSTIEERDWWKKRAGYPTLTVYFGNGKTLDSRVISDKEEGFWYMLNISDVINYKEVTPDERIETTEGKNKITFINTFLGRYIPDRQVNMIIEDLEIGYLPREIVERYSKPKLEEYGEIRIKEQLKGKTYELNIGENGEIEVKIGDEKYKLVSSYSYPGEYNIIGYNWFGSLEKNWKIDIKRLSEKEVEVKGDSDYYTITRKIRAGDEKIEVKENVKNKRDSEIGIMITHKLILEDLPSYYTIAGVEEIEMSKMVAENPTIFVSYKDKGVGFVAEDNVLRVQGEIEKKVNTLTYSTRHFGIDRNKEYTFEFSIYPILERNYFTFINKVRKDWNVNTKIEGPFVFSAGVVPGRKAKIYTFGFWLDYYDIHPETGKLVTWEEYKNRYKSWIEKLKRQQPDAKLLGKVETNIVTIDKRDIKGGEILPNPSSNPVYGLVLNKKQSDVLKEATLLGAPMKDWMDSVLLTEEGNIIVDTYYPSLRKNDNFLNLLVYVEKGNHRFKHFLKQIDFLMDEVGFDGVYIDQFSLTVGPIGRKDRHTYDRWDGYTVDIDEKTGKITRKYTDCGLIGAEGRRAILEYIISKGGIAVINWQPGVKEERGFPNVFRFSEYEDINPLAFKKPPTGISFGRCHLSTPIVLGVRPERLGQEGRDRFAEVIMKGVITGLRNGVLYYYYSSEIPREGPGAGEYGPINHMFPITIVEINEGYIIGKERIITCVSKKFNVDKEPIVYLFDLRGREKQHNFDIIKKGNNWEIDVKINDWEEIVVIELE